jgi:hypothetical protein
MLTIALWVILWVAVGVVIAALFSISKEKDRVFVWKDEVATELYEQFNVDYRIAFQIVDGTFSTWSLMYKTGMAGIPRAVALRLFWRKADESGWMPHHFNKRIMPDELYHHHSWGGIIVEA